MYVNLYIVKVSLDIDSRMHRSSEGDQPEERSRVEIPTAKPVEGPV